MIYLENTNTFGRITYRAVTVVIVTVTVAVLERFVTNVTTSTSKQTAKLLQMLRCSLFSLRRFLLFVCRIVVFVNHSAGVHL